MEILLTGRTLNGVEAGEMGLAQKVVDCDENGKTNVLEEAKKMAMKIGGLHPLAVRTMVHTLRLREDSMGCGLESSLRREAHAQALCYAREDWGEGLQAVVEKRQPSFDNYQGDWL